MYRKIPTIALLGIMAASPLEASPATPLFGQGLEQKVSQNPKEPLSFQQEQTTLKDVYNNLSDLLKKYDAAVKQNQPDASVDAQREMHKIVETLNIMYNLGAVNRNAELEYDGKTVKVTYTGFMRGSPLKGKVDYTQLTINQDGTALQTIAYVDGRKVILNYPAARMN